MQAVAGVRALCSFLAQPNYNLRELLEGCPSIQALSMSYLGQQLLSRSVEDAISRGLISRLQIPEHAGCFAFRADSTGMTHVLKGQAQYTTLDRIVKTPDDVPALVELRTSGSTDAIKRYFDRVEDKETVMHALYPGFAWVLVLPLEFVHKDPHCLEFFKSEGGQVAILPYSSADMVKAIEASKKSRVS